jgi:hypothetical protein
MGRSGIFHPTMSLNIQCNISLYKEARSSMVMAHSCVHLAADLA